MTSEKYEVKPGTLYLVSTPIGNLRDISLRALDVLAKVDLIAAEDTRTSRILLDRYDIRTPTVSHHDFNEERVAPSLIAKLKAEQSIAVISDAGTPGISDPAFHLVRQAIAEDIRVECIPGATAFVPALVLSGLPTDRFVFEGFLPAKKGRASRLQALSTEPRTIILYESPHRIIRTVTDLYETLGDRQVTIVRELTKKFETIVRSTLEQIVTNTGSLQARGEFVIVLEGLTRRQRVRRKETQAEPHR
ncbi:16S rRNA (cytidine(1402)-2'-O)-methyltransferase [candidate division KSB1 bacterium]|nr:16S rRNA (cytidine(1402)-2'-O)-methyltransferase [candidate division KSB1 bacterium]RQW09811.1 MAG: 16S rRNA (cytidine(1402)-2'-O)-methyltransferase [candidate division KSB1 bacterium]